MIDQVRRDFVPVAVNLYKIRERHDAAGDLFRSVQRQVPNYQGIWIVTPNGKVLAAHQNYQSAASWTREVLATMESARAAFGPIAPRQVAASDPIPHRGVGTLADGGVDLALASRYVRGGGQRSAPAAVKKPSLWMWDGPLQPDGPPVIDSVVLTPSEWASMAPPQTRVGEEWTVPEAVACKFSRALSPSSDQSTMPRPAECTAAELRARIEGVDGDRVTVRLAGRWEAKHVYLDKPSYAWANATGTLVCDQNGRPRSLTMLFSGAYRMAPPYDNEDRPIGAVVEWRRETDITDH